MFVPMWVIWTLAAALIVGGGFFVGSGLRAIAEAISDQTETLKYVSQGSMRSAEALESLVASHREDRARTLPEKHLSLTEKPEA
ncbi:MAG: hypothetical protein ACREXY_09670 [Gammaproteobacteria bacterium]